jgi:hypothetical protein
VKIVDMSIAEREKKMNKYPFVFQLFFILILLMAGFLKKKML